MLQVKQNSISQVPSYEEFYGLIDDELYDEDFEAKDKDEDVKKIIALALSLLQDFYLQVKFYTAYDILSERFEEELAEFNTELKESLLILFNDYLDTLRVEQNQKYEIPSNVVDSTIDFEKVLGSAADSVTDILKADLTEKAQFYQDMAITTGAFSLHSNFRRAIKQLTSKISNNAHHARKLIEREYLVFVYGQEALFYWKVKGVNTCEWCYANEAMGAMPLSYWGVDHINGNCWLEPANPNEYSEEYKKLKGW